MNGDDNPKKIKVKIISLLLLLVTFVILIGIAITFFSNIFSESSRPGLFSRRIPDVTFDELSFDVGRARMFAHTNGSVAAAGTLGVQVFNTEGNETLRDSFRMTQPAVTVFGNRFMVYDIGGTSVRVFTGSQILSSFETDGTIVSASGNQNGWFCVVTQRGGGIRGTVTVYNNNGARVFEVDFRTGFVLTAEISPDNKNLAILNFTDTVSRVTFYKNIDTEDEPSHVFDLTSGLIIDISYLPAGDLLVISTDLLFFIDEDGVAEALYPYHDKRLGSYTRDENFIALHIYDYGIGHRGRIVTLTSSGNILGESATEREVISMSAFNDSLVILKNDGIVFYSDELEEFSLHSGSPAVAGSSHVVAIREDTALAASDSSAIVFRRED